MSEDNTNKPQNDYGSDYVYGDCDKKSDGEDNSDGDTTRDDGCDAADGKSCNAEVTKNHVGAAVHDKGDDGYDEYDDHDCVDGDRKSDGDVVLLRDNHRDSKKGDKLKQRWLGTYKVYEVLDKGDCRLENSTGKVLKTTVNVSRLKTFTPNPMNTE
eukprot:Em0004g743a